MFLKSSGDELQKEILSMEGNLWYNYDIYVNGGILNESWHGI